MKRLFGWLVILVAALVALPPLYYAVFPAETIALPAPGKRMSVGEGLSVDVVERGTGSPIVLVHGLPGIGNDWRLLTDALADHGHRVLAYSRVGYGRSDPRPDEDFTVSANARELLGLLEGASLRGVTAVGWSYGGPVVMQAATLDPSRFARLVVIGSGGPPELREDPPAAFAWLFSSPVLAWMRAVPPVSRGLMWAFSDNAFSGGAQPDWWMRHLAANLAQPHSSHAWIEEGKHFFDEPMDPAALTQPLLLLHGDDDRLVPLEVAHWIDERARDSELVVYEGGSHMLPVTHTADLADRISAFTQAR